MIPRIRRKLSDIRYSIRDRFQRFMKGYSTDDLIDFDYYLQTTFVKMIREFSKGAVGYPQMEMNEIYNFDIRWLDLNYKEIVNESKDIEDIEDLGIYDEFVRYKLILKRIAWCIEHTSDSYGEYENKYWKEFHESFKSNEVSEKEKKKITNKYFKECNRLNKLRDKYAMEGFTLLAKYYNTMWW